MKYSFVQNLVPDTFLKMSSPKVENAGREVFVLSTNDFHISEGVK